MIFPWKIKYTNSVFSNKTIQIKIINYRKNHNDYFFKKQIEVSGGKSSFRLIGKELFVELHCGVIKK